MKLYLFQLATLQPDDVPVPAYLVQTDDGQNILIEIPGGRTVYMDEGGFIANRLATIGVRPADVHTVICTHLDADHAGGHSAFSDAEFVTQKTNYELARASDDPRFAALRETWHQPNLHYRLVEGDKVLCAGVELIESSGHVPGHQAVLLRLPQTGNVLLAIDAVPHSTMSDADTRIVMTGYDMDEAATRASTRKLAEVARREKVALTIYGHDAGQWATLKHAPQFYD